MIPSSPRLISKRHQVRRRTNEAAHALEVVARGPLLIVRRVVGGLSFVRVWLDVVGSGSKARDVAGEHLILEEIEQEVLAMREGIELVYGSRPVTLKCETSQRQKERSQEALQELAFFVVAAFRGHSHISNVLTHISGSNWSRVEATLRDIFDPSTTSCGLSPLARNIIELMCADRGVTGRILKPFYRDFLANILGKHLASRVIAHVEGLFLEFDAEANQPVAPIHVPERSRMRASG